MRGTIARIIAKILISLLIIVIYGYDKYKEIILKRKQVLIKKIEKIKKEIRKKKGISTLLKRKLKIRVYIFNILIAAPTIIWIKNTFNDFIDYISILMLFIKSKWIGIESVIENIHLLLKKWTYGKHLNIDSEIKRLNKKLKRLNKEIKQLDNLTFNY